MLQDYCTHLLDLIRLRIVTAALQVYVFFDSSLTEHMMPAFRSLLESQAFKQRTDIVEPDSRVRRAAENSPQSLARAHTTILPACSRELYFRR